SFYAGTPLEAFSRAEGTNTDLVQAFASVPNILMAGADQSAERLRSLGFTVEVSDEEKDRIARSAEKYRRDRLPVRELSPMEYLAWYEDGPITAKAGITIPRAAKGSGSIAVVEGETYDLQVRWERNEEQAGEDLTVGKGRSSYIMRTFIDRGFLVFRFRAPDGRQFRVREVDADQVQAMVDAFGLPEVKTVDDLPLCERKSWAVRLDRLIEKMAERNGGLHPYPVQREDVLRMATKSSVALLYEMGGGKTMASAYWAALRGYRRVLIVTPASVVPGIIEDLSKWGFKVHQEQLDHRGISQIKAAKCAKEVPEETEFWVASYESMGLQDGCYDAWSHEVYDREGMYLGEHTGNHGAKCSAPRCKVTRSSVVRACPKCGATGADWRSVRGSNRGGARMCRKCGHRAWTAGMLKPATAEDESVKGRHMAPLGPRIKRLFSCVILDEVQDAKSKGSLKGETTRALRAKGRAVLSGTWLKGYVTDLFWSAGWLLGFGSPLWPFPYNGGSARFLEQFGTFEYVTKEFATTLQTGKRKLIPSVSNLGRLWRLLSPFTVRRLKTDFLKDLPPKHRQIHWTPLDPQHAKIYRRVEEAMQDTLKRELQKAEPNMGVISMALWWGRYAAGCPTEEGGAHYAGAFGTGVSLDEATPVEIKAIVDQLKLQGLVMPRNQSFEKVTRAMELIHGIQAKGEKVIVFTSLRGLYAVMARELKRAGIRYVGMDGVSTKKRNGVARKFEGSRNTVLLAGTGTLNRGVTINGANHIIILNTEWSPETTLQAEDRCHRPGQTRDVYVHYVLGLGTMEEQMWSLLNQKAAAQRAVFDKEAQFKSVEDVMSEAVGAQMQVARAMVAVEREVLPDAEPVPSAAISAQNWQPTDNTVTPLPISPNKVRRSKQVPEAQLSFFGMLTAAG
ncbi:MAG: SNF2-related protein, partial [Anaerolineae bacterium]|nr:SNF2-related protein [Anaerolineae bacterium]